MRIQLSASTLSLYRECPRCFWLHFNRRIQRPRGIFPSLPGAMDNVIKAYFDEYRQRNLLPPEIMGEVTGSLISDKYLLAKWRDWRTGLRFIDKDKSALLRGALDDCLIDDGYHVPIDFKTRGSAAGKEYARKYYSLQMSCYSLLLRENGFQTADFAYLIFYYPASVKEKGIVEFSVDTIKLETDAEFARTTFHAAIDLLRAPDAPEKHSDCEYCHWLENFLDSV
jgi:hypothetical protein